MTFSTIKHYSLSGFSCSANNKTVLSSSGGATLSSVRERVLDARERTKTLCTPPSLLPHTNCRLAHTETECFRGGIVWYSEREILLKWPYSSWSRTQGLTFSGSALRFSMLLESVYMVCMCCSVSVVLPCRLCVRRVLYRGRRLLVVAVVAGRTRFSQSRSRVFVESVGPWSVCGLCVSL